MLFLFYRLNFQFCPSSRVYGFTAVDLKPGGEDEVVNNSNMGI